METLFFLVLVGIGIMVGLIGLEINTLVRLKKLELKRLGYSPEEIEGK